MRLDSVAPDSPRRILFVNAAAEPTFGAERCLLNIIRQFSDPNAALPEQPIVCLQTEGPLADQIRALGVPVHIIDLGIPRSKVELRSFVIVWRVLQVVLGMIRLMWLIHRENIDVVHSNSSIVVTGAMAAWLMARPHIWHVREVIDRPRLARHCLRFMQPALSRRVICISSAVRDNFGKLPPRLQRKLVILHDGIDLQLFDGRPTQSASAPGRVGMVARINRIKGHALFIESAKLVHDRFKAAEFTLVGGCLPAYEPLKEQLMQRVSDLDLVDRVTFLGAMPPEQVRDHMAELDVLVLPTLIPEGLGLTMIEAMAMGKPVVAAAHGGPLDVIRDGVDGVLFPPGDAQAMAAALISLLRDPERRMSLGRAARQQVVQRFSLEQHVGALSRLYSEVLSQSRHQDRDEASKPACGYS